MSFAAPAGNFNYWTDTEPLKNGTATSTGVPGEDFLGTVLVDVYYSGDSNYRPADVNASFTVTPGGGPPFTLSATPVVIAVPGATAGNTSTTTVTPMNSFVGAVYLSCALNSYPAGAQYPPTCSIPASVNVTGTNAVTATMVVNSTAASSSAMVTPWKNWPWPNGPAWFAANMGVVIFAMILLRILYAVVVGGTSRVSCSFSDCSAAWLAAADVAPLPPVAVVAYQFPGQHPEPTHSWSVARSAQPAQGRLTPS